MGNIKGVDVICELKIKKSRSANETSSQSYGVRLPFGGITQCYLPPDTSEHTPP